MVRFFPWLPPTSGSGVQVLGLGGVLLLRVALPLGGRALAAQTLFPCWLELEWRLNSDLAAKPFRLGPWACRTSQ